MNELEKIKENKEAGREIWLSALSATYIAVLAYFGIVDGAMALGAILLLSGATTTSRSFLKSKKISNGGM